MARVKRIENSRKPHTCGRGAHEIPKGQPYLTAAPGFRARPLYRCVNHPFRASELTTSLKSEPLAAVEAWEDIVADGIETHEDLQAAWEELGQALEDYVSTRQEALDAWENGNGTLEEFVYEAEAAYDEWSSFEPEEFQSDEFDYEPDEEKNPKKWQRWNEERQEHLNDQISEAESAAGSISL